MKHTLLLGIVVAIVTIVAVNLAFAATTLTGSVLSDNQAVTSTANSTNVCDTGVAGGTVINGSGALDIIVTCTESCTSSNTGTLTVTFVESASSTLGTPTTIYTYTDTIANTDAGDVLIKKILPRRSDLRYLGVVYTTTQTLTAGKFSAAIVPCKW